MNIKLGISEVMPVIDRHLSMERIAVHVGHEGAKAGLLMATPQSGAGYLQWNLPGNDWTSLADACAADRELVGPIVASRFAALAGRFSGSPLAEAVVTLPSEAFVYYRRRDNEVEIAAVAWGYRYHGWRGGGELAYRITRRVMQRVAIGFGWGGTLLPAVSFRLNGLPRVTSADDSLYHLDGELEAGTRCEIETVAGQHFGLVVEWGRENYIFDLTRRATASIAVTRDGDPVADCAVRLAFNGETVELTTDSQGCASHSLTLACTPGGSLRSPQPECEAECEGVRMSAIPDCEGEPIVFRFDFVTPAQPSEPAPAPETVQEPAAVRFTLLDYGGYPLPDLDFTITTRSGRQISLRTDSEGCAMVPRDLFSDREKVKVDFRISAAYRLSHNIHDKKHTKKQSSQ